MTIKNNKIVFIDTNVLSYWLISKSMDNICNILSVDKRFKEVYNERYSNSISLISKLMHSKVVNSYVLEMVLNELRSSVRDEIRSFLLFKKGIPISRWSRELYNYEIEKKTRMKIMEEIYQKLDMIYNSNINFISDVRPFEDDNYFDVFDYLFFHFKNMKTQDAMILTSIILLEGDFFVTLDKALLRERKKFSDFYKLNILSPEEGNKLF